MTELHIAALQEDWKKKEPPYAGFRKPCIGKCGIKVDPANGSECRKCRRKRLLQGRRRIQKMELEKRKEEHDRPSPPPL